MVIGKLTLFTRESFQPSDGPDRSVLGACLHLLGTLVLHPLCSPNRSTARCDCCHLHPARAVRVARSWDCSLSTIPCCHFFVRDRWHVVPAVRRTMLAAGGSLGGRGIHCRCVAGDRVARVGFHIDGELITDARSAAPVPGSRANPYRVAGSVICARRRPHFVPATQRCASAKSSNPCSRSSWFKRR